MKACLVVLKPRRIAVSESAIAELPSWLPVIELVGYTEAELAAGVFSDALARNNHDFYLVCSDDLIVRWPAVAAVISRLNHETVTSGYCQFTHTDWRVNATSRPLQSDEPAENAYHFLTYREVISGPPTRRTWFTGMSLTAMSRQMWLTEFPFGCFVDEHGKGYGSDFHLSKRLQDADVAITLVRDAFAYHWRNEQRHTNDPRDDRVLVGEIAPEIRVR